MARQSVAAGGRGGHLKSVPDATHPPTHPGLIKMLAETKEVSLACPWVRESGASCSTARRRTSLIWGLPLAVEFSVL